MTSAHESAPETEQLARQIFTAARIAQRRWASTSIAQRAAIFLRMHDLVLDCQEELLDTIQEETGKNRASAFDEVMDVAITCRHYAYRAHKLLSVRRVRGALPLLTRTQVTHEPIGVVGVIAPWNYPLSMALCDAIPALLAGNAVVLKPDEKTAGTARLAAKMLLRAGLPHSLFQLLEGPGPVAGQAVVAHCDYLMFTGSTATGRKLATQAAQRLIGFSAELGGKNALIVAEDAEVERAAKGAVSACFTNSGQLCISMERIYLHHAIAAQFLPRFVELTTHLRIGAGREWGLEMGSLISVEHVRRVDSMVKEAVKAGARVLAGGRALPELGERFYAPTILIDVPPTTPLCTQEVFGPVVHIEVVDSHAEAIARANASDYGLNASVWGTSRTARAIAAQLEAGTVNINEGFAAAWASLDAPMGGWKQSGIGRRHGDQGLLKYTEARSVAQQYLRPLSSVSGSDAQRRAAMLSAALRWGKRILR